MAARVRVLTRVPIRRAVATQRHATFARAQMHQITPLRLGFRRYN